MEPREPAARANGIVRRFPVAGDVVVALDHVDVELEAGRITVIAGPSGSGKSTLLSLLSCVQRPDEGSVHVGSTDVLSLGRGGRRRLRRDRLGIVLPQPSDNLLDRLDARGNLEWAARQRRADRPAGDFDELLGSVGLAGKAARRVRELSGGEQQRLAVACAMVGAPEMIILDEPTASLDRANAAMLVDVLAGLGQGGTTMVVATHDPVVVEAGDAIVELDHGRRIR